ncbi:fungal-specific transcription factor domain-containing protein [Trametes maxima]|nr:fungal-specific transcription factor domain-containing protein [Trametes maxima]
MPNKAAKVSDAQGSDDEGPVAGPSGASGARTQRSAKACDRCRKSKSKCEPSPIDGEPCKSCATTGAECAYTAPSFRRGPPKGYIQALEHRLHQVESVLAAIMSSQDMRSRSIVDELSKDELASYILDTVDAGPFASLLLHITGRTGREKRSIDTTKDNFFSSIVAEKPKVQSHRSRRESRATREHVIENVIARDPQIQTTRPTLAWQDRLSARLALSFGGPSASPLPARSPAPLISASTSRDGSEPPRTKRRLDAAEPSSDPIRLTPAWSSQSAAQSDEEDQDDLYDCAEAFGNLSIDENREVRYHGNASGLQLLVHTERTDRRNIEGIWDFPMAKFWPGPPVNRQLLVEEVKSIELTVRLPPTHVQDRLIEAFFTYINPAIPVVDEASFMEQYRSIPPKPDTSHPFSGWDTHNLKVGPDHPQPISKLLLFAIFAYTASHLEPLHRAASASAAGDVDVGWSESEPEMMSAEEYAICARRILDTVYHESRISTVQALILLGVREFGIGDLEEAWLHVGIVHRLTMRQALDLGLNRNPDKWMQNGRQLFTEKEKEVRKRIWWACCLADKTSAVSLGRTIAIHEGDFSTPLLDVPPDDQDRIWQPRTDDTNRSAPVPGAYMGYFRNMSSLYIITGEILAKVYRVSRAYTVPSRALRQQLYNRLLQWALELPEHLNYSVGSARPCPAPHIVAMHIQYWATVLLLHRPFIPKGAELARGGSPSLDPDAVPWESYDICQSAASQIASFAFVYHEKYDMRWAPPFLSNCLQAAGYVLQCALRYKPLDAQASAGLQKCIHALSGMEATWAMALRVRHLIQNAKVNVDQTHASAITADPRPKRPAQVAFEHDDAYDERAQRQPQAQSQPSLPAPFYAPTAPYSVHTPSVASQASSSSLGFDFSASAALPAPSFTGYVPGYDSWWPVVDGPAGGLLGTGPPTQPSFPAGSAIAAGNSSRGPSAQQPGGQGAGLPSQEFTFGQEHFSIEFLQAMRNPMLHFPSAFAHQY